MVGRTVLNFDDLKKKAIPHRFPFSSHRQSHDHPNPTKAPSAFKCVSGNEPFFQGHFPEHAIMPGVLIVEAMGARSALRAFFSSKAGSQKQAAFFSWGMERDQVSASLWFRVIAWSSKVDILQMRGPRFRQSQRGKPYVEGQFDD